MLHQGRGPAPHMPPTVSRGRDCGQAVEVEKGGTVVSPRHNDSGMSVGIQQRAARLIDE